MGLLQHLEGEITKIHKFRLKTILKSKEGTAECDRGGLRTSQVCAKCVGEGLAGLGRGPSTFPGEQGGIRARQQQEWPFLHWKSKPHHLERQDTRVKEQSVKFPHDYKMQNYTKIEKIDRFLMCIKTNKAKKTPKSPECNTEPLGRLTPTAVVSSQLHSPIPHFRQGLPCKEQANSSSFSSVSWQDHLLFLTFRTGFWLGSPFA